MSDPQVVQPSPAAREMPNLQPRPVTDIRPIPSWRQPSPLEVFSHLDMAAGVVMTIMILGPLAMAAFWAPYH
jgi:hypothetical protein